jgi:phosphatidylinositol alpha-mannosyltransferase
MMLERRRLRLAMFSYCLPVDGERRGGIERAAHTLADGLARRGHDVTVFTHDPRPARAGYEVRPLPWKPFVNSWIGRRITMGYLGNVLAILPDYRGFDAVIMHGDSLLAPLAGRPVLRVMHGSARREAQSATSFGRYLLQYGVFVQELLTALCQDRVVAVSENARRDNPFIRRVLPHGVDDAIFTPTPVMRSPEPSILFVGSLDGRKRGRFLLDAFVGHVQRQHPSAICTGGHGYIPLPVPMKASVFHISKRWRVARPSSPPRTRAVTNSSTPVTMACYPLTKTSVVSFQISWAMSD